MAYTRYVLEAGYSGDFLDLIAAMVPCVMGYGEIGLTLQQEATSNIYKDWIDTYAGAEYQDLCRAVGAVFDAAVEGRLGAEFTTLGRWRALEKTFEAATHLECGFWSMALDD